MILMNGVSAVASSTIVAGHLVLLKHTTSSILAVRAIDPNDPSATQLLYFSGTRPQLTPLHPNANLQCIDLGTLLVLVEPTDFSMNPAHSAAGHLAIDGGGTAFICYDQRTMGEARVDIRTGTLRPNNTPAWYAARWKMGVAGVNGAFEKLYEV